MILPTEKVRFVDHNTFVEAEPPEGRSRPLEWRRSLNHLRIEVSSFVVDVNHWINECDTSGSEVHDNNIKSDSKIFPKIKPDVRSKISIHSKISLENIRDCFYRTVEEDKASKVYSLSLAKGNLVLTLSEGEALKEDSGVFYSGAYYGSAGIDGESGDMYIDVTVSKTLIENLINEITANRVEKIIVIAVVDSFSSEVDDALRDWHHSRDLFIHGFRIPAAVEDFVIRSKSYTGAVNSLDITLNEKIEDNDDGLITNLPSGFLVKDVVFDTSQLKSIKLALWGVILMLFLLLLK